MPDTPRCFALVPCAGVGQRAGAGGPKQYAALAGRAVVAHTLAALAAVPRLAATLVVLSPDDASFETHVPGFAGWVARTGGATRADSVAAGLQALRERGALDADWVLVHDAARCLLQPAWVKRLIDACIGDDVGGLLALPLADTLKAAVAKAATAADGDAGERVAATLDRRTKWLAQTPQMFRLGLLQRALREAAAKGVNVTDESSAVEALGLAPRLVPGDQENFKLTWPADFALAARLLETR
ncbi:MAG: 2-C-methyl-D-erythritol 4-phosphate cytidylyltransferase [Leptothrix sp. (in: Bacteria)]|nr:2-C-methyl-D-erythritol 4-phosphate cytidylyltransferase [Leptothrix sp. (in: b-proteobacteria)]